MNSRVSWTRWDSCPSRPFGLRPLLRAQFFKAANWGRIANGQRADLVLLEGNPLDDIRMTRRIRSVVLDGKYYDRSTLDTLLRFGANR